MCLCKVCAKFHACSSTTTTLCNLGWFANTEVYVLIHYVEKPSGYYGKFTLTEVPRPQTLRATGLEGFWMWELPRGYFQQYPSRLLHIMAWIFWEPMCNSSFCFFFFAAILNSYGTPPCTLRQPWASV